MESERERERERERKKGKWKKRERKNLMENIQSRGFNFPSRNNTFKKKKKPKH